MNFWLSDWSEYAVMAFFCAARFFKDSIILSIGEPFLGSK